jgi:hypothetical protein
MIRSITVTSLFAALLGMAGTALAQEQDRRTSGDVLLVERSQAAERSMNLPRRGLSMGEVERRFGAPDHKHAPVGGNRPQHPPITRWTYPEFSVYFEHSTVIDSVANQLARETGPKPPAR